MTKKQIAYGVVLVLLLAAVITLLIGEHRFTGAAVFPNDPSITNFTRLSANDFINGGIEVVGQRTASLNQASTTACALTSPAATSTLLNATALFTVGTTTLGTITIATSTTGGSASTTQLMNFAYAANSQSTYNFVPTTTDKQVLAPSTGVVVTIAGGVGTYSPTGVCSAMFQLSN